VQAIVDIRILVHIDAIQHHTNQVSSYTHKLYSNPSDTDFDEQYTIEQTCEKQTSHLMDTNTYMYIGSLCNHYAYPRGDVSCPIIKNCISPRPFRLTEPNGGACSSGPVVRINKSMRSPPPHPRTRSRGELASDLCPRARPCVFGVGPTLMRLGRPID
jgi:hypothetical protein